jgi:hypothetical protein
MATTFPGSGSTRGTPPKLVGAPAGATWTVAYEVDFTDQGPGTVALGSNGDKTTFDGKEWTVQHQDNGSGTDFCTELKLVNGVGLQIVFTSPGLTDSYQDPGLNFAPRIQIPVSSLVAGVTTGDVIAFQILAGSSVLNDDWQFYGLMLGDGPTGNDWIENSTVHWTAGGGTFGSDVHMGAGGRALVRVSSEIAQRELVWYASSVSGSSGFVAGGDSSASFIDPLTGSHLGVDLRGASTPAGIDVTTSNAVLSLHAYYNDALGSTPNKSFTATWTKLRVLKMD